MRHRNSKGTYLLEFSLVTLGLVFAVVGILDVGNLLRARSAIKVGLDTGMRCLYPTDADCSRSSSSPTQIEPRYNVYGRGASDGYRVPQYEANANADYATIGRRSVVPDISYDGPQNEKALIRAAYPVQATFRWIQQVLDLPVFSGGPLSTRFITSNTGPGDFRIGNGIYPAPTMITKTTTRSCGGENQEACLAGVVNFSPITTSVGRGDPASDYPKACFRLNETTNALEPCTFFSANSRAATEPSLKLSPGVDVTQAVIAISGEVFGADDGAEGSITVDLVYPDGSYLESGSRVRNLKGRIISDGSVGNFVPRGLGALAPIDDKEWQKYKEEIVDHQLLLVPVGRPFSLKFYLSSSNGKKIGWKSTSIVVYTPEYQVREIASTCPEIAHSPTDPILTTACRSHPLKAAMIGMPTARTTEGTKDTLANLGCTGEMTVEEASQKAGMPFDPTLSLEEKQTANCTGTQAVNKPCPTAGSLLDCTGTINDEFYKTFCPAPPGALNVRYQPNDSRTKKDSVICTRNNDTATCDGQTFPLFDNACPSLQIKYSHPTEINEGRNCGPSNAELYASFIQKFEKTIDPGVPYTKSYDRKGTYTYYDERPKDECLIAEKITKDMANNNDEYIIARGVTKKDADAYCKKFKGACRTVEIQPGEQHGTETSTGEKIEAAIVEGRKAIEAAWPNLATVCNGEHSECSALDYQITAEGLVQGSGSARVPLRLLSILPGQRSITVSANSNHMLERTLGEKGL